MYDRSPEGYSAARSAFGTVGVAMVTPFDGEGRVDLAAAEKVASHLVDLGNDSLVISGTTGESPTTSDAEKLELLRAVRSAVGGRAKVVAGVGTNDTAHSIHLAREAADAGADGLLVVTPYYSKPPQSALAAHFRAVADATDVPVMLYDIPGRSGVPIETRTLIELDQHPTILAVKDAKSDLAASATVIGQTDLAYYSGEDAVNFPVLAIGGIGIVSVVGHIAADQFAPMVRAALEGRIDDAAAIYHSTLPLVDAIMNRMPGVMSVKAALHLQGVLDGASLRPPLTTADADQIADLRAALTKAGYLT